MTRRLSVPAARVSEFRENDVNQITTGLNIAAEYFETAARDARASIPAAKAAEAKGEGHALITAQGYETTAKMFDQEAAAYRALIAKIQGDESDDREPALVLIRRADGEETFDL